MMDDQNKARIFWLVVIAIVILSFFAGRWSGSSDTESHYRKEAVDRGYAEYNSKTGIWEWKP